MNTTNRNNKNILLPNILLTNNDNNNKQMKRNKQRKTKLYCTFCNATDHDVSTCKQTSLINKNNKRSTSLLHSKKKPPLYKNSINNNNILNNKTKGKKKITSLKKLRKKLNTDTSSITALKYANHHLNVSFEKTSIQLNNEKNNIKRDKAIRRKERLAKLKNNIDSNLNNIQSLNKKVLHEIGECDDKKTESWLLDHSNRSSAFIPYHRTTNDSSFSRHRAQIQRMRVSSNPLTYQGMKERINRLSFTIKNASSNFKDYIASGSISNVLRKVSRSLPDSRTIMKGTDRGGMDKNSNAADDDGEKKSLKVKSRRQKDKSGNGVKQENVNTGGKASPTQMM